jgi:hypothetical protein
MAKYINEELQALDEEWVVNPEISMIFNSQWEFIFS